MTLSGLLTKKGEYFMKRLWYLTVSMTVVDPETREPLLLKDSTYSFEYVQLIVDEYGVDDIAGEWFAL